jgi:endonuclease YncB( thermonuclease family)
MLGFNGAITAYAKSAKSVSNPAGQSVKLIKGEHSKVSYVSDGDSLILATGLKVVLASVQAPKRAWPQKDLPAWPLSDEARNYLQHLCKGKNVQLYYGGDRRDRYGRALAQVWLKEQDDGKDGVWLQEAMVEAGYARVYTWPKSAQDTKRLYAAERRARAAQRGIWGDDVSNGFYQIRKPDPNPLAQYVDSVQIVEGFILSSADVRGTVYLNFGSDYKTDFTIAIAKKNQRAFVKKNIDLMSLEGARVRVRGWIELQNGPVIWLNDPNRLEVLD